MELGVLWRGPLSSCNYDCGYCPFAKRPLRREELHADQAALERFSAWGAASTRPLSVLFTPWGEALVHRYYQETLARMSRLPHLRRVAIQTNLSAPLDFLSDACAEKVGLWATWHPGEVRMDRFIRQVEAAAAAGARVSAGVVGQPGALDAIEELRRALPPEIYVWINAVRGADYPPNQRARLLSVDPLFQVQLDRPYPSRGRPCRTGETVIAVDGDGDIRRCHFVPEVLGNLYRDPLEDILRPRGCPNTACSCHIGYVHMPELGLYKTFGEGLLERIPHRSLGP